MKTLRTLVKLAVLAALVVCGSGCSAARKPVAKSSSGAGAGAVADLSPGQYELWVDQRCRRESRKFSHLADDAYMRVAEEKRFIVFRTRDRLLLRSVEGDVELDATPHADLPGIYEIHSAHGGVLSIRDDGPRGKRADLVLFGSGSPYLACDRGSLRAVATL